MQHFAIQILETSLRGEICPCDLNMQKGYFAGESSVREIEEKKLPNPNCSCLPRRRFKGSSSFITARKRLLNREQHSFPKLSQSNCTFQILDSWPWPQSYPIITRSARNTAKALWPLINVRLIAAKVRFSQILDYSVHYTTLAKERKEGKR